MPGTSKKPLTFINVPVILMMLSSLILIGAAEFALAKFDIEHLKSAEYWFSLFSGTLANFMMLASAALTRIDVLEAESEEVKNNNDVIQDMSTNYVEKDMDEFIEEGNALRKTKAWKIKIDKKILKLEKKLDRKRCLFRKRRVRRLSFLNKRLDDKFISEHLNSLKVKYYHMTKMELISGYKIFNSTEDRITYNKSRIIFADNAPKFMLTMSITLFISAFAFEPAAFAIHTLIKFIVKFMLLIWNAYQGFSYAKVFLEKVIIRSQKCRIEEFKKYLTWKIAKKEQKEQLAKQLEAVANSETNDKELKNNLTQDAVVV